MTLALIIACYALIAAAVGFIVWTYADLNRVPTMHRPSRHLIRRGGGRR